jgi:hypothetical protein
MAVDCVCLNFRKEFVVLEECVTLRGRLGEYG